MKEHYLKIFRLANVSSGQEQFPDYVLRDGRLFRTAFHPKGWSEYPDYMFNQDGKIYRTAYHEQGPGVDPDYIIGAVGIYCGQASAGPTLLCHAIAWSTASAALACNGLKQTN